MARKMTQQTDCWGFRPKDGKESVGMYIMRALEEGGKSKDTIRSEYMWDFGKEPGASNLQSTFTAFFSDVVQPFGHASSARSLIIQSDAHGRLSIDPSRARAVKEAVSKGIMKRIGKTPGEYPPDKSLKAKKDLRAIETIREEFRVPNKREINPAV